MENLFETLGECLRPELSAELHKRQTKCTIIQDIDRAWLLAKAKHLSPKQFDYLYELDIDQLYEVQNNIRNLCPLIQSHP